MCMFWMVWFIKTDRKKFTKRTLVSRKSTLVVAKDSNILRGLNLLIHSPTIIFTII